MEKPTSPPQKERVQPSDIPAWANAFSGALGGAIANLIVFPLDLVTTRLQVQEKLLKAQQNDISSTTDDKLLSDKHDKTTKPLSLEDLKKLQGTDAAKKHPVLYQGMIDAAVRIYNEEGILAFYDGAVQDTLSTMLSAFFYFYAYDMLRSARLKQAARNSVSGRPPSTLGIAEELLIGSTAGIFCKFFTAPLNNIVTRQQTAALVSQTQRAETAEKDFTSTQKQNQQAPDTTLKKSKQYQLQRHNHTSSSALQVAREIYSERGLLGFWSGFGATILLSVNPSLTYYFFQTLKVLFIRGGKGDTPAARKADRARRRENPTSWELFLFSASAKTLASLITYPLILVKSQMQVKGNDAKDEPSSSKSPQRVGHNSNTRKSMVGTLCGIVKNDGVGHLYQGARAQILKGFFSQGITMLTKDQIARFIIYIYFFSISRIRKAKASM